MKLKSSISFLTVLVMSLSVTMVSAESMMMRAKVGVMVGGAMMVPNLDIVENAMNAKSVTTLVAAVKAAGLVETLKGTGPFTVFAPDNTAFARLPKGTVESLLKPENHDKLVSILTYHVVPGALKASDLKNGMMLTTVQGAQLKVKKAGRNLWINGSRITIRDVVSKNGVTHVINMVLMPPMDSMMKSSSSAMSSSARIGVMVGGALMVPNLDIVDNAVNANNVTTLVAAVKAAGLVETLKGKGPFTVFAPTNDAFAKLPAGTVEMLLKPENKAQLASILTYHVVVGNYKAFDLTNGTTLTTVQGGKLMVTIKDGKVWINGAAMVETANVISSNGVTHVIDTVLMPK